MQDTYDVLLGILLVFIGFGLGLLFAPALDKVSFETSAGFNCIEQEGTEPCPTTFVYRKSTKDEAIEKLGQIIIYQGGSFELIEAK